MTHLQQNKYEKEMVTMIWSALICMIVNVAIAIIILCIRQASNIYALYHMIIAVICFMILRFIWIMIDLDPYDIHREL